MLRLFAIVVLTLQLWALCSAAPSAQGTNGPDTIAEAARLRDAREYTAAIALLRRHLADHPEDASALRILAQTLYWSGDPTAARRTYEDGERRHPHDRLLRLEHARMLVQLDEQGAAKTILLPLRSSEDVAGEAEALLGTMAYWRGDLSAARAHFQSALRLHPGHADAERHLAQIRDASAPWIRTGTRSYGDDQPIARVSGVGEAGVYLSPLTSAVVQVEADRLSADGARTSSAAGAHLRSYWPRLRLQTEVGAGVRRGAPAERSEWTGRASVGLRLPEHLNISVLAEREPYLRTFASLWQPVMIETARGRLDWETPRGWIAQAAYSRVWYPDQNVSDAAYGWLLLPLHRGARAQIRAGYAYAWEDSRESRFAPVPGAAPSPVPEERPPVGRGRIRPGRGRPPVPPGRPSSAAVSLDGYYAPYYTPIDVRTHSLAAALSIQASTQVAVRLNASYGVHAREQAPFLTQATEGTGSRIVQSEWYERRYTPMTARGGVDVALARGLQLQVEIEHQRTAIWTGTQVNAGVTYRFLSRPPRPE